MAIANGIYPGWQAGDRPVLDDPRTPAPSPEEVGRGPIAAELGRFTAVRLTRDGAVLEYEVAGTPVQEWVTGVPGRADVVVRHVEIAADHADDMAGARRRPRRAPTSASPPTAPSAPCSSA